MKFFFSLTLAFICIQSFGQSAAVRGRLKDPGEDRLIQGATVTLTDSSGKTIQSVISTASGQFILRNISFSSYTLRISSVEYNPIDTMIRVSGPLDLGTILLSRSAKELEEVVIRGITPPVKQKADTLEFNASSYKVNPDANVEDVVRKMPGITIENGVVKAGGEDVRKVTIDGREFFGDDANAALKNLPAEVVDKIQVFDRLSDQAQLTGVDDGNSVKAINVVTKANMRNGQFGRVYAGYGTDDRYSAGGNVTFLKENRRISLVGMTNNVNQQNFGQEDLLGVTSTGGGRGGRSRFGGGSGNFMTGQVPGISKTNSFGINFSDAPSKKLNISGSYFFNNSNNETEELVDRQIFSSSDSSSFYSQQSNSSTKNTNHRLNLRMEYKIDSSKTLIVTPSLSFQNNDRTSTQIGSNYFSKSIIQSATENFQNRSSSGYNFNNNVLYRQAFGKKGRSMSVNINTGLNTNNSDAYLDAFTTSERNNDSLRQFTDQLTKSTRLSANLTYAEPLGKKGSLNFNYNPSYTNSVSDKQVFQFEDGTGKYSFRDDSLSNVFDNQYITQNAGITYRRGDRDNNFQAGLAYQRSDLNTEYDFPVKYQVKRTFSNFLPNLRWSARLSAKSNLRVFYRSSVDAPSVNQLQEVINNNNPLFLSTGNANLSQSYSHRLFSRYNFTQSSNGLSLFANVFFQKTDDYIGNASYIATKDSMLSPTVTLFRGAQLTKPVNMDGHFNYRSFITLGMPVKFLKSSVNLNLGHSYTKSPGMINSVQNYSRSNNFNVGAVIASNVSEYIDFNISYSANFNTVKNSVQPRLNNEYFTQSGGVQVNLLTKSGWVMQNDLGHQAYKGLTDGFNQTFWLWNLAVGKKFLKDQKGELRLSVFDLLKQNKSISRDVTETYIEDVQTRVLQQYFMLTFSYRLRNFGKGNSGRDADGPPNNFRERMMRPGQMGPGRQ